MHRTIQHIRTLGKKPGVVLNPMTPAEVLVEILPDVDQVLVMTVNPGFGGQKFIASTLAKIRRVRALIDQLRPGIDLEVDGGIDAETAPRRGRGRGQRLRCRIGHLSRECWHRCLYGAAPSQHPDWRQGMILAGDIGGTKTILGLFEEETRGFRLLREDTFSSRSHGSFEEILAAFLGAGTPAPIQAGCFGVAGPILDGWCRTTNLPWELDEHSLAAAIHAPRAKLLNDLEATAYGMLFLQPDELCVLNAGAQPARQGHVAVIAAGTGLGEGMLYWDGTRHHPMASEGGHADLRHNARSKSSCCATSAQARRACQL